MPGPSSARSYWFHPAASEEFLDAVRYHQEQADRGEDFRAAVDKAAQRLLERPELGPVVSREGARKLVLRDFRYNLFYAIENDFIRIYAVAHQRRKPGYWLSRMKSE
ncbi:MAG: type II toxin-antitoxin system RelE/ParE family toxin [Thermoanaerobaculia bacterium]